ncbi:MAG: MBL fold metallo-hydrolase [Anaerotignaceae bacterium]
MTEQIYSNPDIYTIQVPLVDNPLKNLNCYVIKTPEKNLIIDTGFNLPECYEALKNGLQALDVDLSKTELFLTHLHSDHVGLANAIMPKDSVIHMSNVDYEYFTTYIVGETWDILDRKFLAEGFPPHGIDVLHSSNPARAYAPDEVFSAHIVKDRDIIKIGDYELTCVFTPGHTPGHMCLYMESKKIMFLGDHVLFDITPNITFWHTMDNALKSYLESLKGMMKFDIDLALPAHRKNTMNFYGRVKEILKHHEVRLEECYNIVKENAGIHSYDIGGKMQWSMRGRNWEDFPMHQKWFAVGETIAHLDYLIGENLIERKEEDGYFRYYIKN